MEEENLCCVCQTEVDESIRAELEDCGHRFCIPCIVQWAKTFEADVNVPARQSRGKRDPKCPLCKAPFTYILSHFELDGNFVEDALVREHVSSLSLARWLQPMHSSSTDDYDDESTSYPAEYQEHLPYDDDDEYYAEMQDDFLQESEKRTMITNASRARAAAINTSRHRSRRK